MGGINKLRCEGCKQISETSRKELPYGSGKFCSRRCELAMELFNAGARTGRGAEEMKGSANDWPSWHQAGAR